MKCCTCTEDRIMGILKAHEAGISVADLCRAHGMMPLPGIGGITPVRKLKMAAQVPRMHPLEMGDSPAEGTACAWWGGTPP
jgi:hypothetical protein